MLSPAKGYILLLHVVVIVLMWITFVKMKSVENIVAQSEDEQYLDYYDTEENGGDGDQTFNSTHPMVPWRIQNLTQESRELADHIQKEWLVPPFQMGSLTINHPDQTHFSQRGQSEFVDNLLNHKRNGFFIEAGAVDGEMLSNSLFFERSRNWTGLLVEANKRYFRMLLKKHRHAHMINACLSPRKSPVVLNFRTADMIGGLTSYMEAAHKARINSEYKKARIVKTQCFPIASILHALNVTHVDYFSLDIEGAELDILKTFPFDQIAVDVFGIEYQISGDRSASNEKLENIKKILVDQNGYKVVRLDGTEDVILSKI